MRSQSRRLTISILSYSQLLPLLALICVPAGRAQAIAASRPTSTWSVVQHKGKVAFENNEFGNAERALKEAVIEARAFEPGDIRLAQSSGELGRLLTVRGRFGEAEGFLEEELRVKEQASGGNLGPLLPEMGSMVKFYINYGSSSKADPLAQEILDFTEGKMKLASEAQGRVTLKKGQPLTGWAGEAAPVMRDPLLEWAITCDDLGNVYSSHSNYVMAEKFFKAALDMKTTILGKEHLSLANSYDSLGSICMARQQYEDAESFFTDSLAMTEKIQPPEHPQVFGRLDKLAKCLIKEGKFDEAEALYLRAQGLFTNASPGAPNQARAAYALGCLYADEKKYQSAAPVLARALAMSEKSNGSCSVSLVPYLEKYAYALYYCGRRGEGEALKARAKNIAAIVPELAPTAKMQAGVWTEAKEKSN